MSTPLSYLHPRDEILALIERIYGYRMTTTSGGNLSIGQPAPMPDRVIRELSAACGLPE